GGRPAVAGERAAAAAACRLRAHAGAAARSRTAGRRRHQLPGLDHAGGFARRRREECPHALVGAVENRRAVTEEGALIAKLQEAFWRAPRGGMCLVHRPWRRADPSLIV